MLSMIVAAGSWVLCALQFDLDTQTAATVAALCTALVGAPLAAWATGDIRSRFVTEAQPGASYTGPRQRVRLGAPPPVADARQSRDVSTALIAASVPGSVVVLAGLGGVGKTQLATWYAHEAMRAGEVDLLLWVDAARRDSVINSFAYAAREVVDVTDADVNRAATRFLDWTAETDKRWLIILDDLTDPADLRGLWPTASPTGRVIVTARRRDAVLLTRNRMVIDVHVFSEQEAVAYLHGKLDQRLCANAAALAADLGFLPLALAQAAAYISDRGIDCDTYRRRLADDRRELDALFPANEAQPDDYRSTVAATWSLSMKLADELEPRGVARCVLELLSLLAPSGAPLDLFVSDAVLSYVTEHRAGGKGLCDADDAVDALRGLHRLSLTSIDDAVTPPIVATHTLLQRVVRERLDSPRRRKAVLVCAQALIDGWMSPERSPQASAILRANASTLVAVGSDVLWEDGAHPLLFRLGLSLGSTGDEAEAAKYFAETAQQAEARLGAEARDTCRFLDRAAHWRGESGDIAGALREFTDLGARNAQVFGEDDSQTLEARIHIARWLGESGRPGEAVHAYEQVLSRYAECHGDNHPVTLQARSWLAFMRGEAGDPAAAVRDFDRLVVERTKVLGPDHRDTLAARHLAARWRGVSGDYDTAATATEAVLTDALRVLGPDHPDTLHFRHSLARWWGYAGDPWRAVEAFQVLLYCRNRILGPGHVYTLANRFQLARWRYQAGHHEQAITEMEHLAADTMRILGPDHRDTLRSRGTLEFWRGETPVLPHYITDRSNY